MKAAPLSRRDRLRQILADLRMPGALEALDAILQGIDGGALTAPDAIEQLLSAQIQLRNNRRLQAAILANLFLHYAFDRWMSRTHAAVPFERYADDAICHCRTRPEAEALRAALEERFAACGLVLHPQKTKTVYCTDTNRNGRHPVVLFDFLGFTFRPRFTAWPNGKYGSSWVGERPERLLEEQRPPYFGDGADRIVLMSCWVLARRRP